MSLQRERSCLSKTLRRKGQGAREFNQCAGVRVQRYTKVQRVEDTSRIRTLEAQLKVARADAEVAKAEGRAKLAAERAKPPREVVRIERIEVPIEKRVEVPVERVVEVPGPVRTIEPSQEKLPEHIESDVDRLTKPLPPARYARIERKLELNQLGPVPQVRMEAVRRPDITITLPPEGD